MMCFLFVERLSLWTEKRDLFVLSDGISLQDMKREKVKKYIVAYLCIIFYSACLKLNINLLYFFNQKNKYLSINLFISFLSDLFPGTLPKRKTNTRIDTYWIFIATHPDKIFYIAYLSSQKTYCSNMYSKFSGNSSKKWIVLYRIVPPVIKVCPVELCTDSNMKHRPKTFLFGNRKMYFCY